MLMQKREQAYYDVFSFFLKQTMKEKRQIEESVFILQQFISSAEQCLKYLNAQKVGENLISTSKNFKKHQNFDGENPKIILLRRKTHVQHAKLIMTSTTTQQCESGTKTATSKREEVGTEMTQPNLHFGELKNLQSIKSRLYSDVAKENPPTKTADPNLVQIIVALQSTETLDDEQYYDSDQSESSFEEMGNYLNPKLCSSFKYKRLCQSHNDLFTHTNQSESEFSSSDTFVESERATSMDSINSADEPSFCYNPISFANTVVKKKQKWKLRSGYDNDVCGDYYFCRTNWKPNSVKVALTKLSKRCRRSMMDLSRCGSRVDLDKNIKSKKPHSLHNRSAIGRWLSRLRQQVKLGERSIFERSWSTPYNLDNL